MTTPRPTAFLNAHPPPDRREEPPEDIGPAVDGPTDAEVMAGPPERFGILFERYFTQLYGYCARRVGPVQAEDVVAETFLTAFERRRRFDPRAASARPWLFGIAVNVLRVHRRAEVRGWRALAATGADPLDGVRRLADGIADRVSERVDAAQATRALAGALAAMPQGQRNVLLLVAWGGLDYAEVAAALRLPIGTVRSRLHRARERLRRVLPPDAAPTT